jgi:hypothetical protein
VSLDQQRDEQELDRRRLPHHDRLDRGGQALRGALNVRVS